MSQSGYNISNLEREALVRWLKPPEVLFILQNHEDHMISNEPPQTPASGSLFLFNKRVLRFFRRDGHSWRRKRDGKTVGEAHERLKVGNVEALNCYYAHGEQNPNFQRRSYWMLDPANEHIVLVHYRNINEGGNSAGSVLSQLSPASHSTLSQGRGSYSTQQHGSSGIVGESFEQYHNQSSPLSMEINSDAVIMSSRMNYSDNFERTEEASSSSGLEMSQALRRIEEQLSLNDDGLQEIFYNDNQNADMETVINDPSSCALPAGYISQSQHQLEHEMKDWKDMLDGSKNENDSLLSPSRKGPVSGQDSYTWSNFAGNDSQKSSVPVAEVIGDFKYPVYSSAMSSYVDNPDNYTTLFHQGQTGISFEDDLGLTISQKQKFTIREISPEWGLASEATKVVIIGSFLCDPSESTWTCMFGDVEVPAQIIQEGVICCHAPPHLPGKVTLCVTSANRESCSEVREFDYRLNPSICHRCNQPEKDAFRIPEELLLLVRFVQLLLSASSVQKGDTSELTIDLLGKWKTGEDSWDQVIDSLLAGSSTLSVTKDWLLQELLKDKLQKWLSSRSEEASSHTGCSLSKKEQGIIHIIAGLGFEWALHPVLKTGVSVNFRDINGWTALHWAARFGREKMVAALIACGALAGAVTDPTSQDPTGKTAGSIAATFGHKGLAGYLSEMELTSHLFSLTLKESELSKGSAAVEAERTLSSVPETNPMTSEDELSLKDTLAAVRNAAQAAARIQSAFRAHSFRKRQEREAEARSSISSLNEYELLPSEIKGLSAVSKFTFGGPRDYNTAALSIQKKYRGWKGRKDFLALRQKIVKIQAHVRGYQVRKDYKVCWAVGILEKVILRWRRRGVGLRGFRNETDVVDEVEDDEDILKVFRKQKVDASIDEAVSRVLSMVESPAARQQYRRLLEKYREAKAALKESENEASSSS